MFPCWSFLCFLTGFGSSPQQFGSFLLPSFGVPHPPPSFPFLQRPCLEQACFNFLVSPLRKVFSRSCCKCSPVRNFQRQHFPKFPHLLLSAICSLAAVGGLGCRRPEHVIFKFVTSRMCMLRFPQHFCKSTAGSNIDKTSK